MLSNLPTSEKLAQCRKPTGDRGFEVAEGMNVHHEPLWRWGLSQLQAEACGSLLDVGCGGGRVLQLLAERFPAARLSAIDYSAEMVAMSRRVNSGLIDSGRLQILQASVSRLPFDDESFDLATAFETSYFWPDLEADLREVRRVLKRGGTLIVVNETYRDPSVAEVVDFMEKEGNMTVLSPAEQEAILIRAGFENVEIATLPEQNWIAAVARVS